MTRRNRTDKRVLALDPSSRGFGFAVLEGPERLIDWGVKEARADKNRRSLRHIDDLLKHYQPDIIVIEEYAFRDARRSLRVQKLLRAIHELAARKEVKVRAVSRPEIRKAFAEYPATTKHQIAEAIARRLPELAPRVPPLRQPWMSEDYRMSIFDAVALALTLFDVQARRKQSRSRS
jgi:Holliday junction resolvasome RuvABC endonuclease subunit